ncbi:MAG: glycosyltransferase family 4 protein [Pseudomonadota bacterium]
MKVLMFGWEFPPFISGGLGTACFGLTKELSKIGAEITFVVPRFDGSTEGAPVRLVSAQQVISNPEEFQKRPMSSHLRKYIQFNSALRPYQSIETYQDYLQKLKTRPVTSGDYGSVDFTGGYGENLMAEVVRYSLVGGHLGATEEFDVIHAHDWMTYLAGIEAKKVSGKPLVIHVHATEFDRAGEFNNPDIYHLEKYGMEMADKIITVSNRTKNILIHKYNIDPNKIHVVYNAVEKDHISELGALSKLSNNKDKIVLFLGRITMQKGPEYFIEAASVVLQKLQNVRFVMAGSGDLARNMIEKMATMRLIDRFHFTGFLKEPERERLFAMSDLYIMPSVSEPFGITPLEAMKHGIPVIISKQSGIAEILDDNVVKVDFWDVQKLAQAIIELLSNPKMTHTMVENNRRTLEQIDWKYSAQHTMEVYNQTMAEYPR